MKRKSLGLLAFSVTFLAGAVAFAQENGLADRASGLSVLLIPGVIIITILAIVIAVGLWMRNYIKVPPNQVAVISGRKHTLQDGTVVGSRVVSGGATFKWPVLERVDHLDLSVMNIETSTKSAITKEGVPLTVEAIANVKIGGDDVSLRNAAERFLGKRMDEVREIVAKTLEAHLRAICGTLTVEEINNDRTQFAQKMISEAAVDLKKMGIVIDVWAVQHIQDDQGYLAALGKSRTAQVKRDAEIGQAEATRDQDIKTAEAKREATIKSTEAQRLGEVAKNDNLAQVAQAERDLAVKRADLTAETAAAEARRDQAGPKARAEAEKDVFVAQVAAQEAKVVAETLLQEKIASKTQQELEATIIKQAEAEQKRVTIEAEAAQKKTVINANAAKSQMLIQAEAKQESAVLEAKAVVTRAQGQKEALIAEGDGEAAKTRIVGQAAADANKARLLAEAEGEAAQLQKKLIAQAEGEKARLLAEAEGQLQLAAAKKANLLAEADGAKAMAEATEKQAAAFKLLDEAGRFLLIMEKAPPVIEAFGKAAAEALTPAFQAVGAGLANIDKVTIVETGSGGEGGGGITKFAEIAPNLFFGVLQRMQSLGIDPGELVKKLGISIPPGVGLAGDSAPSAPKKE